MVKDIQVLHILSTFQIGGTEKLLLDILEDMKQYPNLNTVIVVMNDDTHPDMSSKLSEAGYPAYFLQRNRFQKGLDRFKFIFDIFKIIKKHNINVIHTHYTPPKKLSILYKFLCPKLKLIYTVHDTQIVASLSKMDKLLHAKVIDQSVAISPAVYKECEENGIHKLSMILNGIDFNHFSQANPPHQRFHGSRLKMINIARFQHTKKGQDTLLKALKLCKDSGLDFYCRFVGSYNRETQKSYEYLLKLTEELDLQKNVEFIQGKTDVADLLHGSDLFILPSLYEGFGLVVLEAMAAKVPVIVSNIDGPKDLVQDGVNGFLCNPNDPVDLHYKIMTCCRQQSRLNNIIENAFTFSKSYDKSIMAKRYYELYCQLNT